MKTQSRGFIALMSAIIIMAILMLIVSSLSLTGFYARLNIFDSELKERSSALAEGCADQALLELANNSSYSGNATTTIGTDQCYIGAVTPSGAQRTFKTRAIYKNFYTNLKIVFNTTNFSVVSWEEISNF